MLMIKVIAFDLVGVLVKENDYNLNEVQSKIEKLFGPNTSDEEFITQVKQNILNVSSTEIIQQVKEIIFSIYDTKLSLSDLIAFKQAYPNIRLVVATNHISFIEEYILKQFNTVFDKIYISANMNKIKPNSDFYTQLLNDENILPNEMLFLDDSLKNIQGATSCGIYTIHVTKECNVLNEIKNIINIV